MKYEIKIKRQKKGSDKSFWQSFIFEGTGKETIATVIDKLNTLDDLFDKEGNPAERIKWSCSCNQGICGACAMVIDNEPKLACKTKLEDLKGKTVTLEPLSKFPVFSDLDTDRSSLYELPIINSVWNKDANVKNSKLFPLEYEAAKCLRCGICVEVCPNTDINFNTGAFFAIDCFLCHSIESDKAQKKSIKKEYTKNFGDECSKSMACASCCPQGIDIKSIMNKMNKPF